MRNLTTALLVCLAAPATAQTCTLDFTIEVTQGVGFIAPGTELVGQAQFVTNGETFRQEGGTMAHYATGNMTLGDGISGRIWTLISTSRGSAADLIGIYAYDVEGLTFAGQSFDGPMALTLFGPAGTRPTTAPPLTQGEWDEMSLRRSFTLHADADMLAGDVVDLTATCSS